MIRLSIPVRQALARLTLPVLIAAAFGLMLLGKADTLLAERARVALADALAPIYGAMAAPVEHVHLLLADARRILHVHEDNARLRRENARLRHWQAVALALDAENARLKADLHWIPGPIAPFVTARVIADAGGVYARSVLLATRGDHRIRRGEIALDDRGLVGRVTEVGARSVRVLLITDINSRVPVTLESTGARAIMMGTNAARPRLAHWPAGSRPMDGERVVTSGVAGVFPPGLLVGTVHYSANNVAEVQPAARLDRLEILRVFDYGLRDPMAPEAEAPEAGASGAGAGVHARHDRRQIDGR